MPIILLNSCQIFSDFWLKMKVKQTIKWIDFDMNFSWQIFKLNGFEFKWKNCQSDAWIKTKYKWQNINLNLVVWLTYLAKTLWPMGVTNSISIIAMFVASNEIWVNFCNCYMYIQYIYIPNYLYLSLID